MTIPELLTLLSGGGGGAVLIFVAKSFYQALSDRWNHQIEEKKTDITDRSASISDAATANTLLLATIDAMHKENDRLSMHNSSLQEENAQKNRHIEQLQAEITQMQAHLSRLYDQLEVAKTPLPKSE
jgi:peptidoglycan hydrolase CwlO-like protein